MTQPKNNLRYKLVVAFVIFLSVSVSWSVFFQKAELPLALQGVMRVAPVSLNSFKLVNQYGESVSEHSFENKWSLVFFGYTSCPDICPTTLQVLNKVVAMLAERAEGLLPDTQVVFISVDPERDSSEKLSDYMAFFNKDFIGMTGDKKNIDNIVKYFGAGYIVGEELDPGQYQVSHTSAVFLVSPDRKVVASFSQPHIAATIASQYEAIREYYK